MLNCLKSLFNLRVTDTVFHTEIVTNIINPRTGRRWDGEIAKTNWLKRSKVPIVETSKPTGENKGERSIVEAVERTSASLKKLGTKVFIASDDKKYFRPDGEGDRYAGIRLTSGDLLNIIASTGTDPGLAPTPPAPR